MQTLLQQACVYNLRSNIYKLTKRIRTVSAKQKTQKKMSRVTAINIIIHKRNELIDSYRSHIAINTVLEWLNDIQKELED